MALRIGDALRDGASRTFERNGLILVGVFVVFGLLNTVVAQSLTEAYTQLFAEQFGTMQGEQGPGPSSVTPFFGMGQAGAGLLSLSLPLGVALALAAVSGVVAEALRIVSIRVFATTETQTIPTDLVRRNLPWAVLNSVVAGVIVTILWSIGLVFLVFPGIFLAMSFYFVRPVIALEDANLVEAMQRAWRLSDGERFELFGLGFVVWLVAVGVSVPTTAVSFFEPLVGTVLSIGVSGFVMVFGIAATTRAFEQVRAAETDTVETSGAEFGTTD